MIFTWKIAEPGFFRNIVVQADSIEEAMSKLKTVPICTDCLDQPEVFRDVYIVTLNFPRDIHLEREERSDELRGPNENTKLN